MNDQLKVEQNTNFHHVLNNFYIQIQNNSKIKSTDLFSFKRYCPEKDIETLKNIYKLKKENKVLNNDNFKTEHISDEYNPVIVENVFEPSVLEMIVEYFKYGIQNEKYPLGDRQSKRYKAYNDLVSRVLHYELLPLIEHIVKRELIPTYTYLSCYTRGSDLPPHTDRSDCEYTVSFIMDKPNHNWNIYVDMTKQPVKSKGRYPNYSIEENKKNCKKVDCNSGGIMMFNGIDHIHFREKLEADYYHIILLHYRSK